MAAIKPLALKLGIRQLAIVGKDPTTGAMRLYGDKNDLELRTIVAVKFDMQDGGETGWDG